MKNKLEDRKRKLGIHKRLSVGEYYTRARTESGFVIYQVFKDAERTSLMFTERLKIIQF